MKTRLTQVIFADRSRRNAGARTVQNALADPATSGSRRNFLKKTGLGGIALTGLLGLSVEDTIAQTTTKVSRVGAPSDLKITDLRYTTVSNGTGATNARNVIIRIDTNQGISGRGEVREGADARFALFLKSRLLGLNPCQG